MNGAHLTPRGHRSAEAFCLMWYACSGEFQMQRIGKSARYERVETKQPCGHRERIWNSRDGVTPFATRCPSCGGMMSHVDFHRDEYAPEHVPPTGQRVWVTLTRERAEKLVDQRIQYFKATGVDTTGLKREHLVEDLLHGGEAPDMRIAGYEDIN